MAYLDLHIVPETHFSFVDNSSHIVFIKILLRFFMIFNGLKFVIIQITFNIALHYSTIKTLVKYKVLRGRMLRGSEIIRGLVKRLIETLG